MNKHEVIIHSDRCVGCGLCAADCVAGAVKVQDGKAVFGSGCIACGHCEAICPRNAVELTGFAEESLPITEQTRLDPDTLMDAIRTRRTIRVFTDQPVPAGITGRILEAGRLAPTGGNAQNTGFIVLEGSKAQAEAMAVAFFRKLIRAGKLVLPFLRNMDLDENFFFKKAPLVIVLTGSAVNASLAAENMAFMAEACGLGVLFSGFFTMCANRISKLRKLLGMERGEKAVTALVIGWPGVKYRRTARREPAKIRRV